MKLSTIISQLTMQRDFHSRKGKVQVVGSMKLPDENRKVKFRCVIVTYDPHADQIVIELAAK